MRCRMPFVNASCRPLRCLPRSGISQFIRHVDGFAAGKPRLLTHPRQKSEQMTLREKSTILLQDGGFMAFAIDSTSTPNTVNSSVARTREYLTGAEVEKLMEAARKSSRYGHRDATMILIAHRHGLRASEVYDLQWH
jgi:integrase